MYKAINIGFIVGICLVVLGIILAFVSDNSDKISAVKKRLTPSSMIFIGILLIMIKMIVMPVNPWNGGISF
ncbi:MAG: hypothetical protein GF364_16350 [Candidatus Lokiarchaeota archaeon]|nr:hypothetical protein [Candidatus Lokiarchaeota archaeon]